jgi:hypothetical protein
LDNGNFPFCLGLMSHTTCSESLTAMMGAGGGSSMVAKRDHRQVLSRRESKRLSCVVDSSERQ